MKKTYTYIRNYIIGLSPLTSSQPARNLTSVYTISRDQSLDAWINIKIPQFYKPTNSCHQHETEGRREGMYGSVSFLHKNCNLITNFTISFQKTYTYIWNNTIGWLPSNITWMVEMLATKSISILLKWWFHLKNCWLNPQVNPSFTT